MRRYSPPYYSPPRRGYGGRPRTPPRRGYGGERGRHKEQNQGSLLVRNIPLDCRPEELRVPFERFGVVRDVYLPKNYHTGYLLEGRFLSLLLQRRGKGLKKCDEEIGSGDLLVTKVVDLIMGVQGPALDLLVILWVRKVVITQGPILVLQDGAMTTLLLQKPENPEMLRLNGTLIILVGHIHQVMQVLLAEMVTDLDMILTEDEQDGGLPLGVRQCPHPVQGPGLRISHPRICVEYYLKWECPFSCSFTCLLF